MQSFHLAALSICSPPTRWQNHQRRACSPVETELIAYLGEGYEPGTLDAFLTKVRRVVHHAFGRAPDALGRAVDISHSKAAQEDSAVKFSHAAARQGPGDAESRMVTRTLAAHTRHYLAMHKPRAVRHDRRWA